MNDAVSSSPYAFLQAAQNQYALFYQQKALANKEFFTIPKYFLAVKQATAVARRVTICGTALSDPHIKAIQNPHA